jgi:RimJ/RimL family protein N-acetyltransferase
MTPIFGRDKEVKTWVEDMLGGMNLQEPFVAIGMEDKGEIVAGVVYNNYRNGRDIEVHLAGKDGKLWATKKALGVWFGYPFNQLGVERITASVAGKNMKARKFDEHVGFIQEGVMRGALPNDDLIIYGMLRTECRWIGGTNGEK